MDLTERHDLRSGATPWDDGSPAFAPDPLPEGRVDVAICGAGIMGAMLAERLSADGLRVALVDRRPPARGSTAASTALVLWEADLPLTHLSRRVGEAVRRWQRVHRAVLNLAERIDRKDIKADRRIRPSLYLDGDLLDEAGLRAEARLRSDHGLPSVCLDAAHVRERFGIAARPAIVSADSFEVDPVHLTETLLDRARAHGASITWPADVTRLDHWPGSITLVTDHGPIETRHAILAGGYERARLFLPSAFALRSSYAIASEPHVAPLWKDGAMIWEASETYLYARSDSEGRIIAGGGDEAFVDAGARDRLIPAKAEAIAKGLGDLTGHPVRPHERWAAMFGSSPDGLPAIGRAANAERLWLASGFGGNGISFAALAAELIGDALAGRPDPDAECFNPYRFQA